MNRFISWRNWDVAALVSSAIALTLLLIAFPLYLVSATFASRQGDARLSVVGRAMLMIPLVLGFPLIMIFAACLTGNCL